MYLTYDEYIRLGGSVGEEDFPARVHLARLYIDDLTFHRISDIDKLPDWQKDCVKLATFFQIQYMEAYGDYTDSPAQSFSIGGTSMSFGDKAPEAISHKARRVLEGSGLTCRQL